MDGRCADARASRVIGAVTLAWLVCFDYLALSPQIPDTPGSHPTIGCWVAATW
jgi:hypothetical protein